MYSKKERHELITEKVITSVYANHLKYGDKLPSENQLSNALDVPRASIREVYNALDIFGIVESRLLLIVSCCISLTMWTIKTFYDIKSITYVLLSVYNLYMCIKGFVIWKKIASKDNGKEINVELKQ